MSSGWKRPPEPSLEGMVQAQLKPEAHEEQKLLERLDSEPLVGLLVAGMLEDGDRNYPDFLWNYVGKTDVIDPPQIERGGIEYEHIVTNMFTDDGMLVHARETLNSQLALDDPKRYFVATLDTQRRKIVEWRIVRVDVSEAGYGYESLPGLKRELFLAERPFRVPAGPEPETDNLREQILNSKLYERQMEQAYAKLTRLRIFPQRTDLFHDGMLNPSRGGINELAWSVERLTGMREQTIGKVGVSAVMQESSQKQESETATML